MRYPQPTPGVCAPRHNIFFALRLPPDIAAYVACVMDRFFAQGLLRGKRVPRDCLHISLLGLGLYPDVPAFLEAKIFAAIAKLQVRPFRLLLNHTMSFDHGADLLRPFVLTSDDEVFPSVFNLQTAIYETLVKSGVKPYAKPGSKPHLTLSREPHVLTAVPIEPVSWRVNEFCLIDSLIGESRHDILGTWPSAA